MSTATTEVPPNGKAVSVPETPPDEGGEMVTTGFGEIVRDPKAETTAGVLAAQATAAVQARHIVAMKMPRDMDLVRVKVLAACKRPLFAERAIYKKPLGKKFNEDTKKWEEKFAEGLSIRFAEEAVRNLGNAMTEAMIIYDDPRKRIIRVAVTDIETNVVHYKDVYIEKTVERKKLKQGQLALSSRINSYGDPVYIVEATDDDLLVKSGALVSKALRDKILMLIPSDIQEEAKALCYETQLKKDKADPEGARKKLLDAFAEKGVLPPMLAEYLGHEAATLTPGELAHLRAIYSAISEGEATWSEVIEGKRDVDAEYAKRQKDKAEADAKAKAGAPAAASAAAPPAKGKQNVNDLAAQAKAKREAEADAKAKAADTISKPPEKPADAEDKGDAPTEAELKAQGAKSREPGSEG